MACRAFMCKNSRFNKSVKKSFFKFPKKEPYFSMWREICAETWKPFNPTSWLICSDHFAKEDLVTVTEKRKTGIAERLLLKEGAVPVLNTKKTRAKMRLSKMATKRGRKKIDIMKLISENMGYVKEWMPKTTLVGLAQSNEENHTDDEIEEVQLENMKEEIVLEDEQVHVQIPIDEPHLENRDEEIYLEDIINEVHGQNPIHEPHLANRDEEFYLENIINEVHVQNQIDETHLENKIEEIDLEDIIDEVHVQNQIDEAHMENRNEEIHQENMIEEFMRNEDVDEDIYSENEEVNVEHMNDDIYLEDLIGDLDSENPSESVSTDSLKSSNKEQLVSKIEMLQNELHKSETENKKLKLEIWNKEKMRDYEISDLNEMLAAENAEKAALEDHMKLLFTNGQINLIKNQQQTRHWIEDDVANSIVLYATGANFYKMLSQQKFPLPSVGMLQRWARDLDIKPGIILPACKILSEIKTMTEMEKVCVLSFHIIMIKKQYGYDKKTDSTFAPATYVKVGLIRGLMSQWQQPVFYGYDTPLTQGIVTNVLTTIKNIGFNVVALINDFSFFNEIGENCEQPWFTFEDQKIHVIADIPHLVNCLRIHFLESGIIINGKEVNKNIIWDLLSSDLVISKQLTALHLTVSDSNLHNTKLATELFSHYTTNSLSHAASMGHLNGRNWQECYTLFRTTTEWFDVMNGRWQKQPGMNDYGRAQEKILDDMLDLVENMRVVGSKTLLPFQNGILKSTQALKSLFNDIKKRFNIQNFSTCLPNEEAIDNFFDVIRAKDGLDEFPDRQQFKERLRSYVLGKNEAVPNLKFDGANFLKNTRHSLTGIIMASLFADNHEEPCQRVGSECDDMSRIEFEGLCEFDSVTWENQLKEYGLSASSASLKQSLGECEKIFETINGEGLLICKNYLTMLVQHSAHIECPEVIRKLFFMSRMFYKITQLNGEIAIEKLRKSGTNSNSLTIKLVPRGSLI